VLFLFLPVYILSGRYIFLHKYSMETLEQFLSSLNSDSKAVFALGLREAHRACALGAAILDVREEYHTAYKQFGVNDVLYMPLSVYEEYGAHLPPDRWLIIADVSGNMATDLYKKLRESGLTKICVLAGGFIAWERLGLPVNTDQHQAFSGSCVCQLKQRNLEEK